MMLIVTSNEAQESLAQASWNDGCRVWKSCELSKAVSIELELKPGKSSPAEVTDTVFVACMVRGEKVEVVLDGKTLLMEMGSQVMIPEGAYYMFVNSGSSNAWITCVAAKKLVLD